MVGRRRQDPVLAAEVRERLLRILAESGPRRVRSVGDDTLLMVEPDERTAAATSDGEPEIEPFASDDYVDDEEDDSVDQLPPVAARSGEHHDASGPTRKPTQEQAPDQVKTDHAAESRILPTVRWPFGRLHLVVIGLLLVIGLLGAGWAVLRARSVAVETPVARPSQVGTSPRATPSPEPQTIMVHVVGAVREPGVVELVDGSRVSDALDAAGGLKPKADPGELNLAQVLADGQQIVVGTERKPSGEVRDGTGGSSPDNGSTGSSGGGSQVNLNRATAEQLETLPGVGPVTAQKIIAWRDEHERFSRVEELQEVAGIGPKTYAEIAPHVTV